MTGRRDDVRTAEALAPVRQALLARAHQEAEELLAAARAAADHEVAQARQEAEDLRARARAEGEADAASVLVAARTRAERQARGVVLGARREVFEQLLGEVTTRVRELRVDPDYPELLARLRARATAVLGPGAEGAEAPEGGVVAEVTGRRFVCTLPDLARQAAASMGADLERAWS